MREPFTPAERTRVLKLAQDQVTVKQIAARLGGSYDRVRRVIERAEERGEVPAGTLARCGYLVKKAKPVSKTEGPVSVSAPQRAVAAALGPCSVCCEPTSVLVKLGEDSFRLCKLHALGLSEQIAERLLSATKATRRFNKPLEAF